MLTAREKRWAASHSSNKPVDWATEWLAPAIAGTATSVPLEVAGTTAWPEATASGGAIATTLSALLLVLVAGVPTVVTGVTEIADSLEPAVGTDAAASKASAGNDPATGSPDGKVMP